MAPLRIHCAASLTNRPSSLGTILSCIFGGIPAQMFSGMSILVILTSQPLWEKRYGLASSCMAARCSAPLATFCKRTTPWLMLFDHSLN